MDMVDSNVHPIPESLVGIKVIDVDTHLTEPADLWTSRAPKKYSDRMPRVEYIKGSGYVQGWRRSDDTTPMWIVDDAILGFAGGGGAVNKDNVKVRGSDFIHWPISESSPAASYVQPRLTLMDEAGIWGQIVYPNVVGFGGQHFAKIKDPDLRMLCVTIWNDVMAEMQAESRGRINGMGLIPWWDLDCALAEIERIHALGLHGVNTNADPQNQGLPDLSDEYWAPMWAACAGLGLPVNFHIGASVSQSTYSGDSPWPSLDTDTKLAVGSSMIYIGNSRIIANIICSGLLDRHPDLKVVSVESGIGWIPFMLEALDYQVVENNVHHLSLKPSEYFARQMYACFWFEGTGLMDDVMRIGLDNCMFETDFPHPTCLYPHPLESIANTLAGSSSDVCRKLLSENAARVYNIDIT